MLEQYAATRGTTCVAHSRVSAAHLHVIWPAIRLDHHVVRKHREELSPYRRITDKLSGSEVRRLKVAQGADNK